jgi:hypothetical protein
MKLGYDDQIYLQNLRKNAINLSQYKLVAGHRVPVISSAD